MTKETRWKKGQLGGKEVEVWVGGCEMGERISVSECVCSCVCPADQQCLLCRSPK